MSWGSSSTRSLSVLLVLPLLLRRLTPAEISIWYLLSTIVSLQALADLGFGPTFSRFIAYALGGAPRAGTPFDAGRTDPPQPNWQLVEQIWSTMCVVYRRTTIVAVIVLGLVGTAALFGPMSALSSPARGWTAWVLVLAVSGCVLWTNRFNAYLYGLNQIARFRRYEALTSFGAIVTSFIALLAGGRLLAVIAVIQGWAVVGMLCNRHLAMTVEGGRLARFRSDPIDQEVFDAAWPPAWRSGAGALSSRGAVYASGLIYAQIADASSVSSYLLALRAMQLVIDLAQAPFFSKIPLLARLRSEERHADQLALAQRSMRWSYWTYAAGFVGVGLTASPLLAVIGSRVPFVDNRLWAMLGVAFFVEMYGAMHLQLYSTTNHIIWHIVNGVSGIVSLAVSLALIGRLGVYAFPAGTLTGNLAFYSWYSAYRVYRTFGLSPVRFERTVLVPPAIVVGVYASSAFFR